MTTLQEICDKVIIADTLSRNKLRLLPSSDVEVILQLTKHMSTNSLVERLWRCIHPELPTCVVCGSTNVKFLSFERGYKPTCSASCAAKTPNTRAKHKATMLERYGVEHALQHSDIRKKAEDTLESHYGVRHALQSDEVKAKLPPNQLHSIEATTNRVAALRSDESKQKRRRTNKVRYGTEVALQADVVKAKTKTTLLSKYGVDTPFASKEIREKAKRSMRERYGADNTLQSAALKTRVQQTLADRYGSTNLHQIGAAKRIATNMMRYGVPYSISSDSARATIRTTNQRRYGFDNARMAVVGSEVYMKLEDKTWINDQYTVQERPIWSIAEELGVDDTTVNKFLRQHNIPIRKTHRTSYAETELVQLIEAVGLRVETNTREVIDGELDVFVPEKNLAIEFCGLYWHSDKFDRMTSVYHLNKLKQCEDQGIKLITLFEDEWIHRRQQVIDKIQTELGVQSCSRFNARELTVVDLDVETKDWFFDQHHIQGPGSGSINYGLVTKDNLLVAAITFMKKTDGEFILNRFATSSLVRGGFSKLLKHFCRNNNWNLITTFADRRWSSGKLYETCNFERLNILPPDYRYVVGNKRVHKFNFRRKFLQKRLKTFDPQMSEVQNCHNNGVYRIFDCGLIKYVLRNTDENY